MRPSAQLTLGAAGVALGALLWLEHLSVGLDWLSASTGLVCGLVGAALVARLRPPEHRLNLADRVTLVRGVLTCAVLALVAQAAVTTVPAGLIAGLAAVAIALDGLDGHLARRFGTASRFGARFDQEVDALLILVLSVHVATTTTWWAVGIGAAHYLYLLAGVQYPWLRGSPPPRYWAKVVSVIQGVALVLVTSQVLPPPLAVAALAVAGALLAESFAHSTWQMWTLRPETIAWQPATAEVGPIKVAVALVVVGAALLAPALVVSVGAAGHATSRPVTWVPLDGVAVIACGWLLPPRVRRLWAVGAGLALSALILLTISDVGFAAAFDRLTAPADVAYLGSAGGLLADSVGSVWAPVVFVALLGLCLALLVTQIRAVTTLVAVGARRPLLSATVVASVAMAWGAATTLTGVGGPPVSPPASALLGAHAAQLRADEHHDALDGTRDAIAATAPAHLFSELRGRDVFIVVVESYGRTALEGPAAAGVRPALRQADSDLTAAGYDSRSAFLTSPTFGGLSWLAHSTLQSGVWVDSQRQHDELMASERPTLSSLFRGAGWRTVASVPANTEDWPAGSSFYKFDTVYDARSIGYPGPKLGYARVPDQFTLAALMGAEVTSAPAGARPPVLAEVDLASSHTPWTPLPELVSWQQTAQPGAVAPTAATAPRAQIWSTPAGVREAYAHSIAYSLGSVSSFVQALPDDNSVIIIVGDHQPAAVVSGEGSGHDVPITVLSRDPDVLRSIDSWGWQQGLAPSPQAPVWPMNDFRDHFINAFSTPKTAAAHQVTLGFRKRTTGPSAVGSTTARTP